jgi:2,4-dichlorophenol 6-monooxygenase
MPLTTTQRHVPVLIVGGGPAGLTTSMLLSTLGVESLLVERRTGGSGLPKAHIINPRSMEIFAQCGMAERVRAVGSPHEAMSQVAWMTSFAGPTELHGREITRGDSWGGGGELAVSTAASPHPHTNLPQIELEPLMQARARELAPHAVLFDHELDPLEPHDAHVVATVTDLSTGDPVELAADYVVAADGGRTVGPSLGIEHDGDRNLVRMITGYVRSAGLAAANPDPRVCMYWFINPDHGGSLGGGVLVKMGGRGWGNDADRWAFSFATPPDDETAYGAQDVCARVRASTGLPDLDLEILRISEWQIESLVAERFSAGRVFLVGDAAHHHPPTGGLGMNTAIQDAHNLAWKLAAVLNGTAESRLLDTYDAERRPVASRNADQSLKSFFQHSGLDEAIGIPPDDPAVGWSALASLFAGTPQGAAARERLAAATRIKRREFCALNLELGYCYEVGAIVPDGSALAPREDDVTEFVATTRPGHRMPHAWLTGDDERQSTYDIAGYDRFTLFAAPGSAWPGAAKSAGERLGVPIHPRTIGASGDYADVTGAWQAQREIDDGGAVLVRPDQHVAWRSFGPVNDPTAALTAALAMVLGRD